MSSPQERVEEPLTREESGARYRALCEDRLYANVPGELREKIDGYLATAAQEVWIVYPQSKRCEHYGREGLLERSAFAVDLAGLFDAP